MKRSVTGPERIKRLLPSNTVLAHKTGFLSIGVINDAGIACLPDETGHNALAIFITEADEDSVEDMEWLVARIGRVLFRHFWLVASRSKGGSQRIERQTGHP
jgi:beta-lactamase class A